jgi:GNAT superfamily N-acetyltransferase
MTGRDELAIGEGSIADYDSLAAFHYLWGRPATAVRVLVAREVGCRPRWGREWGGREWRGERWIGGGGPPAGALDPVGVLVVSMPPLNAPWRDAAWPGEFAGNKRDAARRINAQVRTISRVVVDPRWRGMGVARRLIAAYLARPLTGRTETLAAMGPVCACFRAAGMREVAVPRARHDARLLAVLGRLPGAGERGGTGIEAWQLLDPAVLARVDERALRVWARASRANRAIADGPVRELALRAARALVSQRAAYVHQWGAQDCPAQVAPA